MRMERSPIMSVDNTLSFPDGFAHAFGHSHRPYQSSFLKHDHEAVVPCGGLSGWEVFDLYRRTRYSFGQQKIDQGLAPSSAEACDWDKLHASRGPVAGIAAALEPGARDFGFSQTRRRHCDTHVRQGFLVSQNHNRLLRLARDFLE